MNASPLASTAFTARIGRALGLLLLTAAALKVYGLGLAPIGGLGFFAAPGIQFVVIAFEVALGVWLLSGKQPIAER